MRTAPFLLLPIERVFVMAINRRNVLFAAPALALVSPRAANAQESVTSGGIGLGKADLDSLFEFVEMGQSGPVYLDPPTGATFQVGFGGAEFPADFASDFWINDGPDEESTLDLIQWLMPDDATQEHLFAYRAGAGTMELSRAHVFNSTFLQSTIGTGGIHATYTLSPGTTGDIVRACVVTVESPN